jgi:copper homeostasis protein CutC
MPGAGITSENAVALIQQTRLTELHGTFKTASFIPYFPQ